jgi:5-methylcytosine-specific restriction endonuclease McrA
MRVVISAAVREAVRQRARFCCEYCLLYEADAFVPHEPDHIVAVQHGGPTALENLALACYHRNHFKGTNLASVDPKTGKSVFLFHPRRDLWSSHFRLEKAHIVPTTDKGRATAALLKFNMPLRLEVRQKLFLSGRYPPDLE